MLFGGYTDNQKAKEFFAAQIEDRMDEIKENFANGEYREYVIRELETLRDHVYGLRDSFGLFTADTITELSAPIMEMLAMLAASGIKDEDVEGR